MIQIQNPQSIWIKTELDNRMFHTVKNECGVSFTYGFWDEYIVKWPVGRAISRINQQIIIDIEGAV